MKVGNLFGAPPPAIVRGQMRQALHGGDAPGSKSRAIARAKGMHIPGDPGTEGTRGDAMHAPAGEAAALVASIPERFRRNGLFPFGRKSSPQTIDPQRLQELVRQMMNGGR